MSVAVRARGLVKRYGEVVAVAGLDLEVAHGSCLGLLGPNGAGKTTTIEILEGLKRPDEGEVEVLGRRWSGDGRELRQRIGVQLQETQLEEKLQVHETLRLFRSFYRDRRDVDEVLELVGLVEKRSARVAELSGGQKQRLALACALVNRPEILFLDEPTTGLDPQARRRVWQVIEDFRRQGGPVLLTTHHMEEAERLADRLVIVDHGRIIAEGPVEAILASLGAESIVELRPGEDGGLEGLADAALLALPGVRSVRREPGAVALTVVDTQASVGALLGLLEREGLALQDLRTHRPTLEDVFVSLTGKHLRDG